MRTLLAQLDRVTAIVVAIGIGVGILWVVWLPAGVALSGIVSAVGAVLLVVRGRWLELGLLFASIGLVPLLVYRWFGPPIVETLPERGTPLELMAPGAAYTFLLIGLVMAFVAASLAWRRSRKAAP